jgi:hypothetical protein
VVQLMGLFAIYDHGGQLGQALIAGTSVKAHLRRVGRGLGITCYYE